MTPPSGRGLASLVLTCAAAWKSSYITAGRQTSTSTGTWACRRRPRSSSGVLIPLLPWKCASSPPPLKTPSGWSFCTAPTRRHRSRLCGYNKALSICWSKPERRRPWILPLRPARRITFLPWPVPCSSKPHSRTRPPGPPPQRTPARRSGLPCSRPMTALPK